MYGNMLLMNTGIPTLKVSESDWVNKNLLDDAAVASLKSKDNCKASVDSHCSGLIAIGQPTS